MYGSSQTDGEVLTWLFDLFVISKGQRGGGGGKLKVLSVLLEKSYAKKL